MYFENELFISQLGRFVRLKQADIANTRVEISRAQVRYVNSLTRLEVGTPFQPTILKILDKAAVLDFHL